MHIFGFDPAASPVGVVDVGAAGAPLPNLADLASVSSYVGFDPDLRSPQVENAFGFLHYRLINRAVTSRPRDSVTFNLTKYPECSSVLLPDRAQTDRYEIGEYFAVVGQATVPAITLDAAIDHAGLAALDWLKLDSQGTDFDLLTSLSADRFNRLLVVEVEPGVTSFYHGENTMAELHDHMLRHGFWLADLTQQRFPRISAATVRQLNLTDTDLGLLDRNPLAFELRYFRTVEFLESRQFSPREWFVLWLVAMTNGHTAYALEVAAVGGRCGLGSEAGRALSELTLDTCRSRAGRSKRSPVARIGELFLPPVVAKIFRRLTRPRSPTRP